MLNKGIYNGIFWAQVKYDKIYMCVVLVYFFTLRMSIFENFMLDDKLVTLLTKHRVIKAERAQTKSGNDAIGYRRILP